MTEQQPRPVLTVDIGGKPHMLDASGGWKRADLVKEEIKLEDETVRVLFARAVAMREALRAFKEAAFGDVDSLLELLDQQYGAKPGGAKGNVTLASFDGLNRIQIQVQDQIQFGPQLQTAKALMDECVADWSLTSEAELVALVVHAFRQDKEGKINVGALLSLRRVAWKDERAIRAMEAISDSIRTVGTKRFIRFAFRADPQAPWVGVLLDLANA